MSYFAKMAASLSCFGVFEVACRHWGSWFEQFSVFGKSNIFFKEWPQVLFIAELHHIFPLNYSKWSISIKIWKERKKMNLKYIYWKNPWSEVWARTYIFQNCHQVDKNPCSQFRHTSQNFVLLLSTACTSTKDVNELSMAKSKFISYIPR